MTLRDNLNRSVPAWSLLLTLAAFLAILAANAVFVTRLWELVQVQNELITSLAKRQAQSLAKTESSAPAHSANPTVNEIFSTARLLPVYEDGELVGMSITHISQGSRWEKLGIREGDRLVAVGDVRVTSPQAVAEALSFLEENWESVHLQRLSDRMVSLRLPARETPSPSR